MKRHWKGLSKKVARLPSWGLLKMMIGLDFFFFLNLSVDNLDLVYYMGFDIGPGYKSQL